VLIIVITVLFARSPSDGAVLYATFYNTDGQFVDLENVTMCYNNAVSGSVIYINCATDPNTVTFITMQSVYTAFKSDIKLVGQCTRVVYDIQLEATQCLAPAYQKYSKIESTGK